MFLYRNEPGGDLKSARNKVLLYLMPYSNAARRAVSLASERKPFVSMTVSPPSAALLLGECSDYTFGSPTGSGVRLRRPLWRQAPSARALPLSLFGPDWQEGCPSCSVRSSDHFDGMLPHLAARDVAFARRVLLHCSRSLTPSRNAWPLSSPGPVPRHGLQHRLLRPIQHGRPRRWPG